MTSTVMVETPRGPGRLFVDPAEQPNSILVLGHGAGGGIGAVDLELLAQRLPAAGTTVVRFEQPWRTAGRKVGAPPPKLDEAWCAALDWLIGQQWAQHQLLVGGRSAGARVACRTASRTNPAAIVCLAFPLHLPGRPEKSRVSELLAPAPPDSSCKAARTASVLRKRSARQSAMCQVSRWSPCPEPTTVSGSSGRDPRRAIENRPQNPHRSAQPTSARLLSPKSADSSGL